MLWIIFSQVILNEVMNHPLDEACGEFVEIYNPSSDTVNLRGFLIADGEDVDSIITISSPPSGTYSSHTIAPGEFALVLDPDYLLGCEDSYGLTGNILTVSDASIGNGLSLRDSIYIMDSSRDTVALFEQPISSVPSGYSVERVNYYADIWGISSVQGGTPNRRNSIYSTSALLIDSLFIEGESLSIRITNMYPSSVVETLLVIASETLSYPVSLDGGASTVLRVPLDHLSFVVRFVLKDFSMVDYIPFTYPTLVINEIEYDESPEWVEVYNSTDEEVNMGAFALMDMAGNEVRLSGFIPAGGYGVFSGDQYVDFPSLNNNYESIILVNRWGMVFDTVYYTSSYGGEGPYTLEKLNPSLPGWERSSWATSRFAGGTPGERNSVFVSESTLVKRMSIEPRYPRPGQDVIFTFDLHGNSGSVEVLLFDDLGRLLEKLFEGRELERGLVSFRAPSRKGIYIILVRTDSETLKGWFRVR